jgi:hypothetical protein
MTNFAAIRFTYARGGCGFAGGVSFRDRVGGAILPLEFGGLISAQLVTSFSSASGAVPSGVAPARRPGLDERERTPPAVCSTSETPTSATSIATKPRFKASHTAGHPARVQKAAGVAAFGPTGRNGPVGLE